MSSTFLHVLIYDWGLYPRNSSSAANVAVYLESFQLTAFQLLSLLLRSKKLLSYLNMGTIISPIWLRW